MLINSLNQNYFIKISTTASSSEHAARSSAIFPKIENQIAPSRMSLLLRKYEPILTADIAQFQKVETVQVDTGIALKSSYIEKQYLQNPHWQQYAFASQDIQQLCYLIRIGLEQKCLSLEEAEEFAKIFIKKDGLGLKQLPQKIRTPAICKRAVKQNPMALEDVPQEHLDEAFCLDVVAREGETLCHIPIHLQSLEILQTAYWNQIYKNGLILKNLPKSLKIDKEFYKKICFLAVAQNPLALEFVPPEFVRKDDLVFYDLCVRALQKNGLALQFIPISVTRYYQNLFHIAVSQNGLALAHVPRASINKEICIKAVKQNGLALKYVPLKLAKANPQILLEAVKQNGKAFEWVKKFVNPNMTFYKQLCWIAVAQYPQAVFSIPQNLRTPKLYTRVAKAAIAKNPFSLIAGEFEEMWEYLRTPQLILQAVKQNGLVLGVVPKISQSPSILFSAVAQNGLALQYVLKESEEEKNDEEFYELLCFIAVQNNGMALQYIPEEKRSAELCQKAVKQNPQAMEFVPKEQQTLTLCRKAVLQDPLALQWVALRLRTFSLCLDAVSRNGEALRFVPWELQQREPRLQLIAVLQPTFRTPSASGIDFFELRPQDGQYMTSHRIHV